MTDRELLELAAKAAGYCLMAHSIHAHKVCLGGVEWNPLTDDGDALRLAVNLNLLVLPYLDDEVVRVTRLDQPDTIVAWGTPPDPQAATRRAIVRAAAELGKAG